MAPTPCTQLAKGAVVAAFFSLTATLPAQVWTGATDSSWNNALNWNPGLPTGAANVTIDFSAHMPVLSSGSVNLSGQLLSVGSQVIGNPAATLTIQSGAQLTTGEADIGANLNVNGNIPGAVTVTGAGSKWTNSEILMGYGNVDQDSNGGSLSILNGGSVVTSLNATIGATGYATATVDGAGSSWKAGSVTVGDQNNYSAASTLTVSNGGYVCTTGGAGISTNYGGNGVVTITGAGTKFDNFGDFGVGGAGSGTLIISAGAKLNMTDSGGNGTVGSALYSSSVPSTATITGAGSAWNPYALQVGGTYSSGSITVSNGGTLTTTVSHLNHGSDSVAGAAEGAAVSIFGQGSTWVNSGADWNLTIGDTGRGSLTLGSGGQLIASGLTLGSGSELHFQLGGTSALTDYGSINFATGATLATLGGLLDVTLVNSFNPNPGATFHLFNFNGVPVSGAFSTIALPTLTGGETWDTSGLYTNGTIVVDAAPVPEPASAAAICGASALGLLWIRRRRSV